MELNERLVRAETMIETHIKSCDERAARTETNSFETKEMIRELTAETRAATKRLHEQFEEKAKMAMTVAEEAKAGLGSFKLVLAIGAACGLFSIAAFFVVPFFVTKGAP